MKSLKKLYLFFSFIIIVPISVKILHLDYNKRFLDIFARYLFDEKYYVTTYPQVKNQTLTPFDHFSTIGWREDKNPCKVFDSKFYKNFSLRNNKYNLNPLQHYVRNMLSFKKTYINPNQLKKVDKLLDNPKYYLALVAIFRNEDRFLKEWIEFYRMLGVEHFYLYNHLSNDNFMEVLQPYIEEGYVDLYDLTTELLNIQDLTRLQMEVYNEITLKTKDLVEWLIVVDTDEFLFPLQDDNLSTLLKKYDQYASLSVNWKIFGSNKITRIPDDKLLIETLMYTSDHEDFHVKTIVKPRYVSGFSNSHFAELVSGYCQVTENFECFHGSMSPKESRKIVKINHYWARDYNFFEETKLSRIHVIGNILTDQQKKEKINTLIRLDEKNSTIYDDTILRFVPHLKSRLFEKKSSYKN